MKPIGETAEDAASFNGSSRGSQSPIIQASMSRLTPQLSTQAAPRRGMVARLEKYLSRACPGADTYCPSSERRQPQAAFERKLHDGQNQLSRGDARWRSLHKQPTNFSGLRFFLLALFLGGQSSEPCNQGRLHQPLTGPCETAKVSTMSHQPGLLSGLSLMPTSLRECLASGGGASCGVQYAPALTTAIDRIIGSQWINLRDLTPNPGFTRWTIDLDGELQVKRLFRFDRLSRVQVVSSRKIDQILKFIPLPARWRTSLYASWEACGDICTRSHEKTELHSLDYFSIREALEQDRRSRMPFRCAKL